MNYVNEGDRSRVAVTSVTRWQRSATMSSRESIPSRVQGTLSTGERQPRWDRGGDCISRIGFCRRAGEMTLATLNAEG